MSGTGVLDNIQSTSFNIDGELAGRHFVLETAGAMASGLSLRGYKDQDAARESLNLFENRAPL
eukprot:4996175-Pyramimonas_sp.AAC.2